MLRLLLPAFPQLFTQVLPKIGQSLKLRNILGKLIIQLRGDLLLDRMDLHFKGGFLARQLSGAVILRERDHHVLLALCLHADKLILKAGDKLTGPQLQIMVFALAALKGFAVHKALKVDVHCIALFGLPLHVHHTGGTLYIGLQLTINVLLCDLGHILRRRKALILAQLDLGADRDSRLKGKPILTGIQKLYLGIGNSVQLLLLYRLGKKIRVGFIYRSLIKNLSAIHSLDHLPRRLSLAEAGEHNTAPLLPISLVQGCFKLLGTGLNGKGHSALFQLLDILNIHASFPPVGIGSLFLLWAEIAIRYLIYCIRDTSIFPVFFLFF